MDQCAVDVTYNREKFALFEVRVYQPSLHAWGDEKAPGEIIIVHKKKTIDKVKPEMLFVCMMVQQKKMITAGFQQTDEKKTLYRKRWLYLLI